MSHFAPLLHGNCPNTFKPLTFEVLCIKCMVFFSHNTECLQSRLFSQFQIYFKSIVLWVIEANDSALSKTLQKTNTALCAIFCILMMWCSQGSSPSSFPVSIIQRCTFGRAYAVCCVEWPRMHHISSCTLPSWAQCPLVQRPRIQVFLVLPILERFD